MFNSSKNILLECKGIYKSFFEIEALKGVDIKIFEKEIVGLLGENGAGKSTLCKILSGLYKPDTGSILLKDKEIFLNSPYDALKNGIGMVYQHFNLVENHTVIENIIIGDKRSQSHFGLIDFNKARNKAYQISEKFGLGLSRDFFDLYVSQLSVGEKQKVEIIKTLYRDVKILILDEPTAVLTPQETIKLFETLKNFVINGISIIFVSHKLNEIKDITDRVIILRKGLKVGEANTNEIADKEISRLMFGTELVYSFEKNETKEKNVIYELKNIYIKNDINQFAIKNINLHINEGEIVGIAGISGNGQKELTEALAGVRKVNKGQIIFNNKDITNLPPWKLIKFNIARIPEDRMELGIILDFNIAENIILENHSNFTKIFLMLWKSIYEYVKGIIEKFNIIPKNPKIITRFMSGGNIQKVLLAKTLSKKTRIIIASSPTRGLDLLTTNYIHKKFIEERSKGCGVLIISEDLDELLAITDRLYIIYKGEIVGHFLTRNAIKEKIGLLMMGNLKEKVTNENCI